MLSTWAVCFSLPSFSLGVEKADFRSFPSLYALYIFLFKKHDSLIRGNLVSCNSLTFFYRPPFGRERFQKEIFRSHQEKKNQGQKKKLYKIIDFAGRLNRIS